MAADAVRKGVGAGETAGEWGIVRLCGQCGFGLGQRAADAGAEERGTRDGGARRMGARVVRVLAVHDESEQPLQRRRQPSAAAKCAVRERRAFESVTIDF